MGLRFRRSFGVQSGSYNPKFARKGGRGDAGIRLLFVLGSIAVVGAIMYGIGNRFISGSGG